MQSLNTKKKINQYFQTPHDDAKPGLSVEDKTFLAIVDKEFCRDKSV